MIPGCRILYFFIICFKIKLCINYDLVSIYHNILRCTSKVREEFASISGDNIKRTKKKILVLYFIDKFLMQFDLLLLECSLNVFMLEDTSCDYIYQSLKCCIFLKTSISVKCFYWFYFLCLKTVRWSEIQKQNPCLIFW